DRNDAVHTFGQTVERKKAKESAKDKDPKEAGVDEKIAELNKCKIQIGERSEAECAPPEVQLDFDSWKHEVDSADLKNMKAGHVLPVNKAAQQYFNKKTQKSLIELVEDPSSLKKSVNMRRMEMEEVASYCAASSLNGIPENDTIKAKAQADRGSKEKKRLGQNGQKSPEIPSILVHCTRSCQSPFRIQKGYLSGPRNYFGTAGYAVPSAKEAQS
ncbi:unnamed protein product, partial [Durusdinium trenchii]